MADAEIIAVGSEMLTSQRLDTNSLFLAEQLNTLGIEVRRKQVIGDDRQRLTAAVRQSLAEFDLVILTGGLGPTEDDVTRDAAAAATGRELLFDQSICDRIEARFRARGRVMGPNNQRQAYLIAGAQALANRYGTAPGQWLEHGGRLLILLPGPPSELRPLFQAECMPRLRQRLPAQVIRSRVYRVTGLTESDLDGLIAPVYSRYTNPATTVLAHQGDIQVQVRARSSTEEEAERLLEEVGGPIEALLGSRIYSRQGESLEEVIGGLLRERGATLAAAESCTGGMVAERITGVPGSSAYFLGSVVAYSDSVKAALLGVDPALLARHTSVSEEVARAMAEGARARTGAAWAVSTTGEAGPESATGAVVGTVFIGLAGPDGASHARRFQMPGGRERIRGFATHAALDCVRRGLLKLGEG
jgi:nicotinamide-nucleotide amidase